MGSPAVERATSAKGKGKKSSSPILSGPQGFEGLQGPPGAPGPRGTLVEPAGMGFFILCMQINVIILVVAFFCTRRLFPVEPAVLEDAGPNKSPSAYQKELVFFAEGASEAEVDGEYVRGAALRDGSVWFLKPSQPKGRAGIPGPQMEMWRESGSWVIGQKGVKMYKQPDHSGKNAQPPAGLWQVVPPVVEPGPTVGARMQINEPEVFYVVCAAEKDWAGVYKKMPNTRANGCAVWKSKLTTCFLFSSPSGKWLIGDEDEQELDFICETGNIASNKKHLGRLPHIMDQATWMIYLDGTWSADAMIKVQLEPPAPGT